MPIQRKLSSTLHLPSYPVLCSYFLLAFLSGQTHAGLISFNYEGSVNSIREAYCDGFEGSGCSSWTSAYVPESSRYSGATFSVGDSSTGSFTYDPTVEGFLSRDERQRTYLSGVNEAEYEVGDFSTPIEGMGSTLYSSFSVVNDRSETDLLSFRGSRMNDDWHITMAIYLHDRSATLFDDMTAPELFGFSDFDVHNFRLTFVHLSTRDQLHVTGNLSDVYFPENLSHPDEPPVPVSGPSTVGLSLLSLAGLWLSRRRKVRTQMRMIFFSTYRSKRQFLLNL